MMSSESGMSHNCGSFGTKKLWVDKEKEGHEKAKQKQEVVQMQKMRTNVVVGVLERSFQGTSAAISRQAGILLSESAI